MKRIIIPVLLALGPLQARSQSIVYDNTTTSLNNDFPLLPEWRNESAEAGDEIWLGGTDREIVSLSVLVWYRGTAPGTIDARIRFRSLKQDLTPDDPFYDGGIVAGLPTVAGMNRYTFAIPNVMVPEHFVWTMQAYNRQGSAGEIGIAYFNPPTVGSSEDFFWLSDMGSPWIPYSWGGDPVANFGSQLTAVPEPASMCALGLGAAVLIRRRRRR